MRHRCHMFVPVRARVSREVRQLQSMAVPRAQRPMHGWDIPQPVYGQLPDQAEALLQLRPSPQWLHLLFCLVFIDSETQQVTISGRRVLPNVILFWRRPGIGYMKAQHLMLIQHLQRHPDHHLCIDLLTILAVTITPFHWQHVIGSLQTCRVITMKVSRGMRCLPTWRERFLCISSTTQIMALISIQPLYRKEIMCSKTYPAGRMKVLFNMFGRQRMGHPEHNSVTCLDRIL